MPHDPRKLLEDMRQAASHVLAFSANSTAEPYAVDILLRSAVGRALLAELGGE